MFGPNCKQGHFPCGCTCSCNCALFVYLSCDRYCKLHAWLHTNCSCVNAIVLKGQKEDWCHASVVCHNNTYKKWWKNDDTLTWRAKGRIPPNPAQVPDVLSGGTKQQMDSHQLCWDPDDFCWTELMQLCLMGRFQGRTGNTFLSEVNPSPCQAWTQWPWTYMGLTLTLSLLEHQSYKIWTKMTNTKKKHL